MATEPEANPTGSQTAAAPTRKRLPPKVRLFNGRVIAIVILLGIVVATMLNIGASHPLMRTLTFDVPTTAAQGQPTAAPIPTCPALRPDPTFGISLIDAFTHQTLCERNPGGIAQPASTT